MAGLVATTDPVTEPEREGVLRDVLGGSHWLMGGLVSGRGGLAEGRSAGGVLFSSVGDADGCATRCAVSPCAWNNDAMVATGDFKHFNSRTTNTTVGVYKHSAHKCARLSSRMYM